MGEGSKPYVGTACRGVIVYHHETLKDKQGPTWRIPWAEEPGRLVHGVAKSWIQLKRLSRAQYIFIYIHIYIHIYIYTYTHSCKTESLCCTVEINKL